MEVKVNIRRVKTPAINMLIISICFLLLSFSTYAASRGIYVKAKTSSGGMKEISLYSGYHALVVGVSDYETWPDLPNATKDAHEIARLLKRMGFEVKTVTNPSSRELKNALNDLTYKYGLESNRAILFYYAGHGETEKLADGNKLGYIIPRDCPLLKEDPQGFVSKAISMKDMEVYSLRIRSKHVLMLFDSCFSGSLFSLVRAVPEDITEKSTLPVRQYITAGTEDETVPDRSMFKRCLILGLEGDADLTRDGYITGTELGLYLSDKVVQSTSRAQHPQYGKIRTPELARGDFVFLLASSGAVVEAPGEATLSVESNVSGARVFVDGQKVGTTQLSEVAISEGEHRILVEKSGYETYRKTIRVKQGRSISLYVDLSMNTQQNGRLYVDTQPADANVKILNIGPAFYQGIELEAGSYQVEVSADGYEGKKLWISLAAGEDKTLDISLKRETASREGKKITNSLGMEFLYIKPGTFMMGSPSSEKGRQKDEKQHRVTLSKGFYIQTTEVTVGQWREFIRDSGYKTEAETGGGAWIWTGSKWEKKKGYYWDNPGFSQSENHPVTCVSWNDVRKFINWINRKEGKSYKLPTEAEWEYACRAGSMTAFANGDISELKCGYDSNLNAMGWYCYNANKRTHPVAQKNANAWGLYDMHGNVWEWCQDSCEWKNGIVTDTYRDGIVDPLNTSGSYRVIRGGSWYSYASYCRSANRSFLTPGYRYRLLGFRLLRTL